MSAVPVPPAPGRKTISVSDTGVATVKIACHAKMRRRGSRICKGVVKLRVRKARNSAHRSGGRNLGGGAFTIAAGRSMTLRVPLDQLPRSSAGAHRAKVIVAATTLQTSGKQTTASRVFSLSA